MSPRRITIDDLERWVLSGAHWRLVEASGDRAVVDMRACTGETVERVEVLDPEVIAYVRERRESGIP